MRALLSRVSPSTSRRRRFFGSIATSLATTELYGASKLSGSTGSPLANVTQSQLEQSPSPELVTLIAHLMSAAASSFALRALGTRRASLPSLVHAHARLALFDPVRIDRKREERPEFGDARPGGPRIEAPGPAPLPPQGAVHSLKVLGVAAGGEYPKLPQKTLAGGHGLESSPRRAIRTRNRGAGP